jgi:hypothetical protein
MFSRRVVLLISRGINSSRPLQAIALVTPLFATLTASLYQYHFKDFSFPLFSYSYALFCIALSRISYIFNIFRTLGAKHPGWGIPFPTPQNLSARFDRFPFLNLYSLLFFHEAPCT